MDHSSSVTEQCFDWSTTVWDLYINYIVLTDKHTDLTQIGHKKNYLGTNHVYFQGEINLSPKRRNPQLIWTGFAVCVCVCVCVCVGVCLCVCLILC